MGLIIYARSSRHMASSGSDNNSYPYMYRVEATHLGLFNGQDRPTCTQPLHTTAVPFEWRYAHGTRPLISVVPTGNKLVLSPNPNP